MEITILKCDRCKKEVGGLIEYSFINRNVQEDRLDELTLALSVPDAVSLEGRSNDELLLSNLCH